MDNSDCKKTIDLLKREVIPAIGCTEPIAVSLCVAKATETLGELPEKIDMYLSANVLKNALGVGIPGTGMIGLPIAIALGAIVGKSEYQLEVLRDITPESVEQGKKYIDEKRISISQKQDAPNKLHIEATCHGKNGIATATISGGHTNFIYITRNGEVLLHSENVASSKCTDSDVDLTLQKVYDFATTVPINDISFILEAAKLNRAAAVSSFDETYGHNLGQLLHNGAGRNILGDTTFTRILSYTSGACDARMGGAMIPVMSNSGSGNQGISATLPVVIYAEENSATDTDLIRALTLSHLMVIYIKQSLGKLSALCGCVVASTGAACGISYLMGANYEQIDFTVQNMIANITGMICDGAKPSCALKVATGTAAGVLSCILAMNNKHVTGIEGIIDDNVEKSIRNMSSIGASGMSETDKLILSIMTNK